VNRQLPGLVSKIPVKSKFALLKLFFARDEQYTLQIFKACVFLKPTLNDCYKGIAFYLYVKDLKLKKYYALEKL